MIIQAIINLGWDKAVSEEGGVLNWYGEKPLPQADIDAEVTRLQAEYDGKQYARDRAKAYPTLTEQADMAYWDRLNGTTTLDDAITAVKNKYPKG
jgi:hypothetical protein